MQHRYKSKSESKHVKSQQPRPDSPRMHAPPRPERSQGLEEREQDVALRRGEGLVEGFARQADARGSALLDVQSVAALRLHAPVAPHPAGEHRAEGALRAIRDTLPLSSRHAALDAVQSLRRLIAEQEGVSPEHILLWTPTPGWSPCATRATPRAPSSTRPTCAPSANSRSDRRREPGRRHAPATSPRAVRRGHGRRASSAAWVVLASRLPSRGGHHASVRRRGFSPLPEASSGEFGASHRASAHGGASCNLQTCAPASD
jgi:hypothetical protein